MKPTIATVLAKARAFIDALARLPDAAQTAVPHGHFARDYNTLRKLALEVAPNMDERLLGKYVGVHETPDGEFSGANYVEIEVYVRQIIEQFRLIESHLAGPVTPKANDLQAIRNDHNQAYEPWSEEDDEYLRSRYLEGATIEDLVSEFGRRPGGIRSRIRKLGLGALVETPVTEGPGVGSKSTR